VSDPEFLFCSTYVSSDKSNKVNPTDNFDREALLIDPTDNFI
jgi:hypothetical protein